MLFTPLCGVHSEDPLCYLLQIDNTRILLDCGWNDTFDVNLLEPLRDVFPTVDLILISFADLEHMGGLAYAAKHFGFKGPQTKIYATTPTKFIGLQYLYDAYLSRAVKEPFDLFDLDDIDALESRIVEKKYNQRFLVRGMSVTDIEIYAHQAGRMLGGAMWKLVRDPDEVLYAVDFNHAKDFHLEGISRICEKYKLKPTLMITDAYNWMNSSRTSLNKRKEDVCNMILSALRRSRSCLMPVDCGGRVLELLYILNQYWNQNKLTYPIVFVSQVPSVLLYAANNLTGFMNTDQENMFLKTRKNPFENLNKIEVVSDIAKVHEFRDPKVVLACSNTLECGLVQSLLSYYGQREGHLILFTDKTMMGGSLARRFVNHLAAHETSMLRSANMSVDIESSKWVYKSGQELVRWKMLQRETAVAEKRRIQQEDEANALRDDMALDGMDMSTKIMDVVETNVPPMLRHQSSMADDSAVSGGGLFAEFAKQQSSVRMFSVYEPERTKKWDEYGEVITDSDYMLVETDDTEKAAEVTSDEEEEEEEDDVMMEEEDETTDTKIRRRKKRQFGDPLSDCMLPLNARLKLPRECETATKTLVIRCGIGYVDLEGRADGPSYKNIIKMLKPRKVVIVHGNPEPTRSMVQSCIEAAIQTVVAPRLGETADVSSDVGMWRIELEAGLFDPSYELFSKPLSVVFNSKETVGVRYVEGCISNPEQDSEMEKQGTGIAKVPVLQPLQITDDHANQLTRSSEPQFVHAGVSSSDVSKVLRLAGIEAEIKTGGFIVCDNTVVVQITQGTERVFVDGPVGALYYKVRELVYGCYVSV